MSLFFCIYPNFPGSWQNALGVSSGSLSTEKIIVILRMFQEKRIYFVRIPDSVPGEVLNAPALQAYHFVGYYVK
jgi:hypothetical protein